MFTVEQRNEVRAHIIEMARSDPRVVSGAEVGSLTLNPNERWGDLDLTFGLADGAAVEDTMQDWTERLRRFGAVTLFDLPHRGTFYRVFLFPENLQVDLSLSPGRVAAMGPKLTMLFGDAIEHLGASPVDPHEILGLAVHHALRARLSVERARMHHAVYYVGELRNETLSLAAVRRELPPRYGRGFDDLPAELLARATTTFVRSAERDEILRALFAGIEILIDEARGLDDAAELERRLRALMSHTLA
ncbi:MAG: hypothetical protein ABR552_11760 [Actinomycetota bacterium]|nr:hypothetical protein [Actinomycetota bacterium]